MSGLNATYNPITGLWVYPDGSVVSQNVYGGGYAPAPTAPRLRVLRKESALATRMKAELKAQETAPQTNGQAKPVAAKSPDYPPPARTAKAAPVKTEIELINLSDKPVAKPATTTDAQPATPAETVAAVAHSSAPVIDLMSGDLPPPVAEKPSSFEVTSHYAGLVEETNQAHLNSDNEEEPFDKLVKLVESAIGSPLPTDLEKLRTYYDSALCPLTFVSFIRNPLFEVSKSKQVELEELAAKFATVSTDNNPSKIKDAINTATIEQLSKGEKAELNELHATYSEIYALVNPTKNIRFRNNHDVRKFIKAEGEAQEVIINPAAAGAGSTASSLTSLDDLALEKRLAEADRNKELQERKAPTPAAGAGAGDDDADLSDAIGMSLAAEGGSASAEAAEAEVAAADRDLLEAAKQASLQEAQMREPVEEYAPMPPLAASPAEAPLNVHAAISTANHFMTLFSRLDNLIWLVESTGYHRKSEGGNINLIRMLVDVCTMLYQIHFPSELQVSINMALDTTYGGATQGLAGDTEYRYRHNPSKTYKHPNAAEIRWLKESYIYFLTDPHTKTAFKSMCQRQFSYYRGVLNECNAQLFIHSIPTYEARTAFIRDKIFTSATHPESAPNPKLDKAISGLMQACQDSCHEQHEGKTVKMRPHPIKKDTRDANIIRNVIVDTIRSIGPIDSDQKATQLACQLSAEILYNQIPTTLPAFTDLVKTCIKVSNAPAPARAALTLPAAPATPQAALVAPSGGRGRDANAFYNTGDGERGRGRGRGRGRRDNHHGTHGTPRGSWG